MENSFNTFGQPQSPTGSPTPAPQKSNELNKNLLVICGTVVLICILASATVLVGGGFNFGKPNTNIDNNNNQQGQTQGTADISKVKTEGNPFVGNANAPVVIAFWSDYQCPFCKRAEQDAITQIYNEYVKAGKVKIVFKDYAFLGSDSQTAAWIARAVWDVAPDKFYDWNKAMFNKQDDENGGWGSRADIIALTATLGIDSVKVNQMVNTNVQKYQAAIDADKAEGTTFGINGTPGTIIGKQLINGAQPYATFKAAIDQQLGS